MTSPVLALHGGPRAVAAPLPPMYPGGMRLDEAEEAAVVDVIRRKRLFRYYGVTEDGPSRVAELEEAFARDTGARHAVAVTSGTAALMCGLAGLGIGPCDEVIVPAYTWIASASAVVAVGAVPILAEVDESLTLDPADVARKVSPHTRAILPVHMRGAPSQMDALLAIARAHGLAVIEDCAQANGASFHGRRVGTIGDVGAFSLQFNKILTSGEGGLVLTSDDEVHKRIQMYQDVVGGERNHIPTDEILPGINFRMPELLGAVGLVQLTRLSGLLSDMRARKDALKAGLLDVAARKGVTFRKITDPAGDAAVALIFFVPELSRARPVVDALNAEGLESALLYEPTESDYHVYAHWAPILNQRTWSTLGGPWRNHPRPIRYSADDCPQTLDLLGRAVHIDISPELDNATIEEMTEGIHKVLNALL